MHAGNLATSCRLKLTLSCLRHGGWTSTKAIEAVTRSCAVHSDIAGLRANGIRVESRCLGGQPWTASGKLWQYRRGRKGAKP